MNEKVKTAFFSKRSANEKRDTIEISRSRISFYPKNSIPFPVIRRNTKELRAWLPWKGEFCAQVGIGILHREKQYFVEYFPSVVMGTVECKINRWKTHGRNISRIRIFNFYWTRGVRSEGTFFYIEIGIQFRGTIDAVNTQLGCAKSIGQTPIFSHIRRFIFRREIPIGSSAEFNIWLRCIKKSGSCTRDYNVSSGDSDKIIEVCNALSCLEKGK